MAHNHFVPDANFYYQSTPPQPQPQPVMPYANFPNNQLPPQFEYNSFAFPEPAHEHSEDRSLAEPFIFKANTSPQRASFSIPTNLPTQKFPAIPISPINTTPRVKAKRTPTVSQH